MKIIILAVMLICIPFSGGNAAIILPWSCDFDSCSDWMYPATLNCCGLSPGGPYSVCGLYEQISGLDGWGGSGKSQVHWVGAGDDVNTGGISLDIAPAIQPREFWMRYYIKYQSGFSWSGGAPSYNKHIYMNMGQSGQLIIGLQGDKLYMVGAPNSFPCTGCGWQSVFSDNLWHCIEFHVRWGAGDGKQELWIDGKLIYSASNLNWGSSSYKLISINHIGSNQYNPNHSGCKAVFFDNLAISVTGPIGPVGGGTPPIVNPPIGLRIIK